MFEDIQAYFGNLNGKQQIAWAIGAVCIVAAIIMAVLGTTDAAGGDAGEVDATEGYATSAGLVVAGLVAVLVGHFVLGDTSSSSVASTGGVESYYNTPSYQSHDDTTSTGGDEILGGLSNPFYMS